MSEQPLVVRGYRALLRLYPAVLRDAHADEMLEVVARRWSGVRAGGPGRRALFVVRTWIDALLQAVPAWLDERPRLRLSRPRGSTIGVVGDLRQGFRALRRAPGFTTVATLTLALGIGANTAIFGIVEAVLLAPLPYPHADRLVAVATQPWVPTELTRGWRSAGSSLSDIAGYYPRPIILTGGEQPLELDGAGVTPNFFPLLGAEMARGRGFTASDARAGAARVAVIGHDVWQRQYGGADEVVGRAIDLDGERHEIVGVLAPGFRLHAPRAGDPQLWVPLVPQPSEPDGAYHWEIPIGRLAAGATLTQAQAQLDLLTARFRADLPEDIDAARWQLRLAPLKEVVVGDARGALLVLQAAVAAVLLLACVNVANLFLVRAGARRQELAVRAALGASGARLLRQLAAEGALLALLGGGVALLLVAAGRGALITLAPPSIPRIDALALDAPVLLLTLAVSLLAGLVLGAVGGLLATRRDLHDALKAGGRGTTGGRRAHRLSRALSVAEVSLALVLLISAGLLVRSFRTLTVRDPGFRTEGVMVVPLSLSPSSYDSMARLQGFLLRARRRIAELPGVQAVAVSNYLPISMGATREFVVQGAAEQPIDSAQYGVVSPDYFRVLDIPLLRGRVLDATDRRGAPPVVVVDEAMARVVWPGENPIGERFRLSEQEPWLTVVGVVGEVRGRGLASAPRPTFYVADQQRHDDPVELAMGRRAVILVRTALDSESLAAPLRRAVWQVDPMQPVPQIMGLDVVVGGSVAPERFRALLLGLFAGIALCTALSGVYGVVACLVAERTREIGIRLAVGAAPRDIVAGVLGWGLRLAAAGSALGMAGALVVNRYLASLLFETSPTDMVTFAAAVLVVGLVTLLACLVPAARAVGVDPVVVLRGERGHGSPPHREPTRRGRACR